MLASFVPTLGAPAPEKTVGALLWVSVTIVTRALWGGLYELVAPSAGIGLGQRSLVLLSALSILFVVFYLPSRYLFLVEDARHPSTWARMWLAMAPLVVQVLVG